MTCTVCGAETKVVDSRPSENDTKRRRECIECKNRFNTIEIDMDYYDTLKPRNKSAVKKALRDGYGELAKLLYRALEFE